MIYKTNKDTSANHNNLVNINDLGNQRNDLGNKLIMRQIIKIYKIMLIILLTHIQILVANKFKISSTRFNTKLETTYLLIHNIRN